MYVLLFCAKTDMLVNLKTIKSSINDVVTYKCSELLLYFN